MPIRPTQTCFDDALDLLEEWLRLDPALAARVTLVHAICLAPEGPDTGKPFAHAWLERDGRIWQIGLFDGARILWSVEPDEYRALMRPVAETRYTPQEALAENDRTGHYGPWKPAYIALCGGGRIFE